MGTSLADTFGWLVVEDSVAQLWECLEKAGTRVVEWDKKNNIAFDNAKNEVIVFISRRKPELKRGIVRARITACGHTMSFNDKAAS